MESLSLVKRRSGFNKALRPILLFAAKLLMWALMSINLL